ncbi:fatty-acid--CoA ligase FadD1 [Gordonia shandongensis]|uniref:fatty-acid--CoA ligase FadD1 n=1 Tax=Gordonia shandongensis TaxID=376351 RepID=UPI000423982D|nr:fatty-acid--CoA ligase FadD1 [Gordonia shandongensis]
METLQSLITSRADAPGVAVRFRSPGGGLAEWSWPDYVDRARDHARTVVDALDGGRPPHVGILSDNSPDMLVALAGAALGGYVLVGLNTTRRGAGLAHDAVRSDVQMILVDDANRSLLRGVDLPGVTMRPLSETITEDPGPAVSRDLVPVRTVTLDDPFMMIFTSGTSGDPKAVLVSHLNVANAGDNLARRFGLTADDVFYLSMPMFHSNSVVAGFSPALHAGGTMAPARFSASRFVDDLRTLGITYLNYVGKPLAYVLATPEGPDDADTPLRITFGNEASDRDIAEFGRRFGTYVLDAFGSTENGVIIERTPETPAGSIGRGLPGVAVYHAESRTECAVARFDETGALVNADDAVGELVNTSGPGFFSGYYNDPAADAERMRGGMFWSGDLAYVDADGWIYLAGRTSDWMRVDGENLAAAPVERILTRLEAVSQVAVYGVPDRDGVGDQAMAALVLRDGATLTPGEFSAFLAAQDDLSPKAWPRYVRLAGRLPTTATNKILKRTLVAQALQADGDVLWHRPDRRREYTVW